MSHLNTLDDLPELLPELRLLSVHGTGRGGGEYVATQIDRAFRARGRSLTILPSHSITYSGLRRCSTSTRQPVLLLTAGPRDLPVAIKALFAGVPHAVYYQVPYRAAITWRDPVHAAGVFLFLTFNALFASVSLCNSANSRPPGTRGPTVVLPFRRDQLNTHAVPPEFKLHVKRGGDAGVVMTTACRLFPERGRGSRDLISLRRLLLECREISLRGGPACRVEHFGDVHETVSANLMRDRLPIIFRGYAADWTRRAGDLCFFFSLYEGFGLAALEASLAGLAVYVNEAFPPELLEIAPSIHRLNTRDLSRPLLGQMLDENHYLRRYR